MGIGISAVLLIIGLVLLTGAVNLPTSVTDHVAPAAAGWMCVGVAVLGFILAVAAGRSRNAPPRA